MFRHYIKSTLRSIKKQRWYSLITLSGLAIGITCFILISFYVRYEFSYEWDVGSSRFMVYGEPDREVAWMVMADRDDPVIHELGKPVEEWKSPDSKVCNRGELLYPTAYGYPESMRANHDLMESARQ